MRCLVKAQLRKVKNCPVCRRENAVATASAENLGMLKFLPDIESAFSHSRFGFAFCRHGTDEFLEALFPERG